MLKWREAIFLIWQRKKQGKKTCFIKKASLSNVVFRIYHNLMS